MISHHEGLGGLNVSRETREKLGRYGRLLEKWNPRINLVAAKSLDDACARHFLDSAQLFKYAPEAGHWVDIGSGGGFPGAVIGIMAAENPDLDVTLIESDQRKCAFLRTVARETTSKFNVIAERIEKVAPLGADVLSARALAPVQTLLEYAEQHLSPDGEALFLKGKRAQVEIEEALERWSFECETLPSETDPEAQVLKIGEIKRV